MGHQDSRNRLDMCGLAGNSVCEHVALKQATCVQRGRKADFDHADAKHVVNDVVRHRRRRLRMGVVEWLGEMEPQFDYFRLRRQLRRELRQPWSKPSIRALAE